MAQFSDHASSSAYISSVEVENLHLREALLFSEQGWREALDLVRKEREKQRRDQNILEINSLQLELDAVHKKILISSRKTDEFQEKLTVLSMNLNKSVEELIDSLDYRGSVGPSEDDMSFKPHFIGENDESATSLLELELVLKKLDTVVALARQAAVAKQAKEEAAKCKRKPKKSETDRAPRNTAYAKKINK